MKRLFIAALLALSSAAQAVTLSPITLLNPVGSTSGQVIASTGASTPPAWTTVTLSGLGGLAKASNLSDLASAATARTNLGLGSMATQNATSIAASGGAIAGITLSGATITNSPISGAAASFTTVSATGLISPTSTIGIKGTATNDNAQSGSQGEYPTPGSNSGTSLTTGVTANATSMSLSAGDWDVQCSVRFNPAASTVTSVIFASVNTTSATNGSLGSSAQLTNSGFVNGQPQILNTPTVRVTLASSGTAYCPVYAGFTTSTMTVDGFIRARRPR